MSVQELRPYQQEALLTIRKALQAGNNSLLQAATGAGKTIIFSHLIQYYMQKYPSMHIVVLAHREQLVRQAYDKLLKVWPEGETVVGLACASVSSTYNLTKPVLIASIQTLARHRYELPQVHLLIVDEAHRLPLRDVDSQFNDLISVMRDKYATMRLLGVTATPYRLKTGYIYGEAMSWFSSLDYQISIEELQKKGFLCSYKILTAYGAVDLSDIKLNREGDFDEAQLSRYMSKEIHLISAVKAVQEYAQDRKHIVVFAVTIEHSERLKTAFGNAGFAVGIVHSQLEKEMRRQYLEDFESGRLQVLCNVGVLIEGWDFPLVDCVVECRPTKSTALYVQMLGRGLRIHEEKEDCLFLDLSGNYRRHGTPSNPKVKEEDKEEEEEIICPHCSASNPPDGVYCIQCGYPLQPKDSEKTTKLCPLCEAQVAKQLLFCPYCGYCFAKICNKKVHMVEVFSSGGEQAVMQAEVTNWQIEEYTSKDGKRQMLRVKLEAVFEDKEKVNLQDYWFFEDKPFTLIHRASSIWRSLARTSPPRSTREAFLRKNELSLPSAIQVYREEKWWKISRYISGGARKLG